MDLAFVKLPDIFFSLQLTKELHVLLSVLLDKEDYKDRLHKSTMKDKRTNLSLLVFRSIVLVFLLVDYMLVVFTKDILEFAFPRFLNF